MITGDGAGLRSRGGSPCRRVRWTALKPAAAAVVCAVLLASLLAPSGQATIPLTVRISPLDVVGPGRVSFAVSIRGLQPGVAEVIGSRAAVGGETIDEPQATFASPVDHFSVTLDLRDGQSRIGGVVTADFPAIPPPGDNVPVTLEVVVRQGAEIATAHQRGVLMLPVVLVPGYLNEIWGQQPDVLNMMRRRGYRDAGPSPTLFWFTYPSRQLDIEGIAHLLDSYVRDVVLTRAYASRFNVIGYSAGGLPVRWDAAFEPSWAHLLNQMFLIAVPNEGSVMSYMYAWYPVAKLARTRAARNFLPTFPFWRSVPGAPWQLPPDGENRELERLNAHPLPEGIRIYAFYGARPPRPNSPGTWAGITGAMPEATISYGTGDGIMLASSVLGESINGGPGVPSLAGRFTAQINLGPLEHYSLVRASLPIAAEIMAGEGAPVANWGNRVRDIVPSAAAGDLQRSGPLWGVPDLATPWLGKP